nr:CHAT domain-containing protein [uncultured Desulfobacter sp.]
MNTQDVHTAITDLQERLAKAKAQRDTASEIDALLAIARLCLDSGDSSGAHMHYKLAEKVIRHSNISQRLHEALGGQGRVQRRRQRPTEALERFRAAQVAAEESALLLESARWNLSAASALRAQGDLENARKAIREAETIIRPEREGWFSFLGSVSLSDPNQVSIVAELEGQIGLTALADNDPDGAEEAYRNAVHLAKTANDPVAINTWSTNLGNAFSRRRLYTEALQEYDTAIKAASETCDPRNFSNTAAQMAVCYMQAYRHAEGGQRLETLADEALDPRAEASILEKAVRLFDQALEFPKTVAVGVRAIKLAQSLGVDPDFIKRLQSTVDQSQAYLQHSPKPNNEGPSALDIYLPQLMSRAVNGDLEASKEAAHLICDIRFGLMLTGGDWWKRLTDGTLLAEPGLDLRALTDTIGMLLEKEQTDAALELLQRYKVAGFAIPTLSRFQKTGAPTPEAEDFLAAAKALRECVKQLDGPAQPDFLKDIFAIRRAGEKLLECSERLWDGDPILCARMGGIIHKEELIDTLPYADPVAIVDYVVGRDATVGVIVLRENNRVKAIPFKTVVFTAKEATQLFNIYAKANLPAGKPDKEQASALAAIGKILHDRLLCSLTKTLSSWGITQLILVPDMLTRFLPLHLSLICGNEIQVAGVDTEDARYLCEVMPTEYAPCLQAVAASQIYKRPKSVSTVAGFADPAGDLPAVRQVFSGLSEQLAKTVSYEFYEGEQAKFDIVNQFLSKADVLLFGMHGEFLPSNPEDSHLILFDRPWRVSDVIDQPELVQNPVLVLAACQVGAVAATPDDRDAYGISGALIAAGASTVLANLWKVEEVSMSYLLGRFLHYLAYPGYRPAAALFRAVKDMRRLKREEVLALFERYIKSLENNHVDADVIFSAENLMEKIEDEALEYPFADPIYWGATVIVGSGWHLPAGAVVGGPLVGPELVMKQMRIDDLIHKQEYRSAIREARELAGTCDGIFRAKALVSQAYATLMASDLVSADAARRTARRLQLQAKRIAHAEEDDALLERIKNLNQYLEE